MLDITIAAQPITLNFDMANIEKYNEETGVLTFFKIVTKEVQEDINGVSFTNQKSYDKKYEVVGFLENLEYVDLLETLVSTGSEITALEITGTVLSNTEAKLVCLVSGISESTQGGVN